MAFDELKQDLTRADVNVRSYLELSGEYVELRVFKVLMRLITSGVQTLLIGLGIIFVLLFLSLGAALALCENLDSSYLGFVLVGAFYVLISILFSIFRKRMNSALLRKFSSYYFDGL